MTDTLLVLNSGSSSLKFQLFAQDDAQTLLASGQVKALGSAPLFVVKKAGDDQSVEKSLPPDATHETALREILSWIESGNRGWVMTAAGHRVVHGGTEFTAPVIVTPSVIERLRALIPLAPLHQPHNVSGMVLLEKLKPGLPQVACFDTAFHATQDPLFSTFALPENLRQKGVRRYGFHGLSYEWISGALQRDYPDLAKGRVVVAHLGAGSSLCALKNGKSVATTMGMTALDGLAMGTRCGHIDPGVLIYMARDLGLSINEVEQILYKESGLKGLSGIDSEVKALLASTDPRAVFAMDYFVMRTAQFISMMVTALGGIDALVFTGGIGENSAQIRDAIVARLAFLGPIRAFPIPTNEERIIARSAQACFTRKAVA